MSKLPIKTIVEGLLKLQETGDSATILGLVLCQKTVYKQR